MANVTLDMLQRYELRKSGIISVHTIFENRHFLDNIIMKLRLPISYKHHEVSKSNERMA